MREFELIARYFEPLARGRNHPGVVLGMGDDCALLESASGHQVAISVDTMVEGRHFPKDAPAEHIGWRALATATSDLAAMGADPLAFTLALTLPAADPEWLEAFAQGLSEAADAFDLALIGGDTTGGPLTVSITVHGSLERHSALRRDGASPGDLVCVTGSLGDASEALHWLNARETNEDIAWVRQRYYRPNPRLAVGQWLCGKATAAIDISDGLLADLGHILDASGVGATLDAAAIPLSPALQRLCGEKALEQALRGGDDYELCFTWPASVPLPGEITAVPVTRIGIIESGSGLRLRGGGQVQAIRVEGFDHFTTGNSNAE